MSVIQIIVVVLGALLALSEALSLIPAVKANGVFQLIVNMIQSIKNALSPPSE